jgi:hypothetical protein
MRLSLAAFLLTIIFIATSLPAQDIKIPGFTAYLDPNPRAASVNDNGVTGWSTADTVLWGGELGLGEVNAAVTIKLPAGETSKLKLTIAGKSTEVSVKGIGTAAGVDFGKFDVKVSGYQRIELAGVSKSARTYGDVQELSLSGPAAKDAFFNRTSRRNASSVHLHYPVPAGTDVAWFCNEVTPKLDPIDTYYEVCGFARGYFGIQVNSKTERRVIFSVWDSGREAKDRSKVGKEDLVSLVAKGDGVDAGSFGNEGTGGHSHLTYMWKTGETQKFLVTAKADGDATIYSGYYYFNDKQKWGLIASFRAPHDGKTLRDLYSFNEDFDGMNGNLRRLSEFGNQWIKTVDGKWIELTTARFTHDGTGGKDRRDYAAGVTPEGRFFLSNGGFIAEPIQDPLKRPATGKEPAGIELPN